MTRKLLSVLLITALGIPALSVHAEEGAIEEVVVVAQKRAENLQEVPISISAFSSDTLEKAGINTSEEIANITPGMQIQRSTGGVNVFLRGIGTSASSFPGNEASVAMYVDGVYVMDSLSILMSLANVERVEVLKGPQGTLFGRNATGGLVHVITKDPTEEAEGSFEVSYGNYDSVGLNAYVSGSISDSVSANLAVYHLDQGEGFGENLLTGADANLTEQLAIKNTWLVDIGDATQARLSFDYSDFTEDFGITSNYVEGFLGFGGATQTGDFHDIFADNSPETTSERYGISLKINHEFENQELVSITAYRDSDSMVNALDQDSSPAPIIKADLGITADFFSQEIHIASTGDGPFQWITGLYYMDSTSAYDDFVIAGLGLAPLAPTLVQFAGEPELDTKSVSAFFQGSYDMSSATRITAGIRYTRDERDFSENGTFTFTTGPLTSPTISDSESWTEPTWRLSIDHRYSETGMVYASYSRGFKSGVYSTATVLGDTAAALFAGSTVVSPPVQPEILDAFEIGIKQDIGNSVRLNASAFYYEYEDIQINRVIAGVAQLLNAAEAEILGAELDLTAFLTDQFEVRIGLSALDTEYTDFPNAPITSPNPMPPFGNVTVLGDASGNQLIRTPESSATLSALYRVPIESGTITAAAHISHNAKMPWDVDNRLKEDSFQIVNAELSWLSRDENWRVRIFGKNLADEEFSIFSISQAFGDDYRPGPPRTYGLAVRYSF